MEEERANIKKLSSNGKLNYVLTHMVENQVLRAAVVLLERSIGGREHGHVAIRQSSVGHLTGFQKLVKLQQRIVMVGIKACSARAISLPIEPPINGAARAAYVTKNKKKRKKKGKKKRVTREPLTALYSVYALRARAPNRSLNKIKQSLVAFQRDPGL